MAHAEPDRIEVRGKDLVADIMGRQTFTEYFYFLMTGKEPTAEQRYFLDLLLVAIAEHGLTPTAVASRITYAADPGSLQAALAAGILGCGTVILGTSELCGNLLVEARMRIDTGREVSDVVEALARETHGRGEKLPGFGHPLHKPVDPRAERILTLADAEAVAGRHIDLARRFTTAAARVWGRQLPMNVSMAIAACLLDLRFPAKMIKAIPLLARTAGLLAHLGEEQERPIGFLMAAAAEEAIGYDGGET